MGPSDDFLEYGGWNIDDVLVTGVRTIAPTDFNNDGATGLDDLSRILVEISNADAELDLNCDGGVGLDDLSVVRTDISNPPGPSGLPCAVDNIKGSCPPF